MQTETVLLAGKWQVADDSGSFQAENPQSMQLLPQHFPISSWADIDTALGAATEAFVQMKELPRETIARFLEIYADRLEARGTEICQIAHLETALPIEPRLLKVELPRTTNQLRQAAAACRDQGWCQPIIDTQNNIRSCYAAICPVVVFGPNNFPLAYNGICGGDFASAIAAGNPVIAKSHPLHPGTTKLLAEEAIAALLETGMPASAVQMLYAMDYSDGERLIRDRRLAAAGFTGGRQAGLKLKAVADWAGKPIYLEMSSINPIFLLPGAISQRGEEICEDLKGSCLMGAGQFCTSPGLIVLIKSEASSRFVQSLVEKFKTAPIGTLLAKSGQNGLAKAVDTLQSYGAQLLCGGTEGGGNGYSFANSILKVSGAHFLENSDPLQTEAFGNATLLVEADSINQAVEIADRLEGNLTGSIYSATDDSDEPHYRAISHSLRQKVGRLLNDKMPTGVAVTAAMNHGGPYPATGHPGFTAVGFPGSIVRFAMLQCFDNVREYRLPEILRDKNPTGTLRRIDGQWTAADIVGTTATSE